MAVRYWATRNDANHNNRHAEVNGIEFFAFPYQPYLSNHVPHGQSYQMAIVSTYMADLGVAPEVNMQYVWGVKIYEPYGKPGETKCIAQQSFESKDEAFEWAASQLKGE